MIDQNEFRKQAHHFVDWMADYLENIEKFPVKSALNPGIFIKVSLRSHQKNQNQ